MTFVESKIEMRPVGQGAFIRGEVRIEPHYYGSTNVRWIYDCGTEASKGIIDASVHDLSDTWPRPKSSRAALDVLILSHFDRDHICGIPTLLESYTFEHIFMPHIPRLKRLVAVLQSLSDEVLDRSAELIELADDPIGFFRARGGEASNLIFVEPAGGEPPNEDDSGDNALIELSEEDQRDLTRDRAGAASGTGSAYLIKSGRRVVYAGVWELIPYVDRDALATLAFDSADDAALDAALNSIKIAAEAHTKAEALEAKSKDRLDDAEAELASVKRTQTNIRRTDEKEGLENIVSAAKASAAQAKKDVGLAKDELEAMVEGLKAQVYEKMGKLKDAKRLDKGTKTPVKRSRGGKSDSGKLTPKEKNAISLMVYMGTIYPRASLIQTQVAVQIPVGNSPLVNMSDQTANGNGILLTGDANLEKARAIDALVDHLKAYRVKSLSVFQVPHHGSSYNSDLYTAQEIGAPFNVFNANPFGKNKHPDSPVVRNFSIHTPAHAVPAPPLAILANARPFIAAIMSTCDESSSRHVKSWPYRSISNWSLT